MATSKDKSNSLLILTAEERLALEQKHDILLLLQQLAENETITIKLIIDRLYDLGTANLIDQKITLRPLKGAVMAIARRSKPAFRMVAIYWFNKNCPQLITDWLLEQVAFNNADSTEAEIAATNTPNHLEAESKQIQQLRSQVKLLSSILIALVVIFGGSFTWLFYDLKASRKNLNTINLNTIKQSIIKVDGNNLKHL